MAPKHYARYRSADGRVWDTRHYDDDKEQFETEDGTVWTRVAITVGRYTERRPAVEELDRAEAK